MDDEFSIEIGPDASLETFQKAEILAHINDLRVHTEDALAKRAFDESSYYNNRIVYFNDVVEYKSCARAIAQLAEFARQSKDPVEIIFHSPGGDIFSGWGLFDYIMLMRAEGIKVTTVVLGGAFSMAGILLQAGDHRVMTPHSWLMIHEAGVSNMSGSTAALKDEVELLKKLEDQGTAIYSERSGVSVAEIERKTNRRNWWLTAEEALTLGFIDEIRPVEKIEIPKPARRRRKAAA